MSQATDNAGELLKELKLTYNRTRQAAITKEILKLSVVQKLWQRATKISILLINLSLDSSMIQGFFMSKSSPSFKISVSTSPLVQ